MKKVICFIVIMSLLFISQTSYAFDDDKAMRKLGRGFANVSTCFIEIAKSVGEANYEEGPVAAITYGFIEGLYKTTRRAIVGCFEIITFPFPVPNDYEPIITDPEFFFSEGLF
jgi:putative exosortase-associated protein (TIGR04073 family)